MSAAREPFRDLDLLALTFVSDPQLSPDGRQVAFTRTVCDAGENAYRSQIHAAAADGSGGPRPLTSGPKHDSAPRYSPDGRYLAFLSDRDGGASGGPGEGTPKLGAQVYVLPLSGGEARRITGVLGGVSDLAWAPDSARLAFVARIRPSGAELQAPAARGEAARAPAPDAAEALYAKHNRDVRYITRLRYRLDGLGWLEDRRAHVFVLDLERALAAGPADLPPPVQVTGGPHDHEGPSWSPDGRWIAVAACRAADPDRARFSDVWLFPAGGTASGGPGFSAGRGGNPGGGPGDAEPARGAAAEGAGAVRVTGGGGEFGAAAFSPDGRRLAYLGHTRPRGGYSDTRLWVAELDGEGQASAARCLTAGHPRTFGDASLSDVRTGGGDGRPVWSPDGRWLYLLGSDRGTTHLYRVDAGTGDVRRVTSGDRVLFGASVRPEAGRAAFAAAAADNPNDIWVAELPAEGGGVAEEGGGGGPLLPALSDPVEPGGADLRRLTRCNDELLARRQVVVPERLAFRAPGGPEVDGWVWRPIAAVAGAGAGAGDGAGSGAGGDAAAGAQAGAGGTAGADAGARVGAQAAVGSTAGAGGTAGADAGAGVGAQAPAGSTHPAVLEIHGGPMLMYTGAFFLEFQLLLARGIGVVAANPRGSQGYGEAFCAGIERWGTADYDDVMAGLDAALERYPWIDRGRLGVAGGSYGGYMTAWVIGHTQRFRAACVMRPVTNGYSFFGSSDFGDHWDEVWGAGRTPWEDPDAYLRISPIAHAGAMRTPALIIESEEDHRCPPEQAEQLFRALKVQGVEAEFLRYPGESHGLSRGGSPWHRVHRLRHIAAWFADRL